MTNSTKAKIGTAVIGVIFGSMIILAVGGLAFGIYEDAKENGWMHLGLPLLGGAALMVVLAWATNWSNKK